MNTRATNWLLFTISVLIAVLVSEAVIRFFFSQHIVLFPRYHTAADYGEFVLRKMRPNTVFWHTSADGSWRFAINTQGFRDEQDFTYSKPAGQLRVLVLGDSHTQGYEVHQDQTYSAVIERYLRIRGIDADVYNTGVSGFSTAEALAFLESEGIHYQPDFVVLGLFANDFEDNLKAGLFKLDGNRLVVAKREHAPGVKILDAVNAVPVFRWLSENSYLYNLMLNTVWKKAKAISLKEAELNAITEYAIPTESVSNLKKQLMTALLKRMYEFCDSRGIKLIIVDIPAKASNRSFRSSIPDEMEASVRRTSHRLVTSEETLSRFRGITDIHTPHGHNHISAFTHTILGTAVATVITEFRTMKFQRSSVCQNCPSSSTPTPGDT